MVVVKADVAVLKTEMIETRDQLGRLERSTMRGFDRIHADFEELRAKLASNALKN
jgi:hypothetical protein